MRFQKKSLTLRMEKFKQRPNFWLSVASLVVGGLLALLAANIRYEHPVTSDFLFYIGVALFFTPPVAAFFDSLNS